MFVVAEQGHLGDDANCRQDKEDSKVTEHAVSKREAKSARYYFPRNGFRD
jgi:hypothetical protein